MALDRLHKTLMIEVRLDNSGVWQAHFTHAIEHLQLGSYVEAGASQLHSGREIAECIAAGLERWSRQPWALEMTTGPQNESEGL